MEQCKGKKLHNTACGPHVFSISEKAFVALKKTKPAGTKDFYGVFPIFGNVVAMLSCSARGCCCCGPAFSIENPKYWD